MSISAPQRPSSLRSDRADRTSHESAQDPSQRRSFPGWRWVAVWLAFPVAGYIGWKVGGHVDAVDAALVGGALTGAGLGAVEWWAARGALGRPAAWVGASAVGYAVGLAAGAALVGYDTDLGALALMGLISGAALGAGQGLALARQGLRTLALPWALAMPMLFGLGWSVASVTGIGVEDQFTVFGAGGALLFMLLSGLLVARLTPARAPVTGVGSIGTTTPNEKGQDRPSHPDPGPRGHIGWIVAGSLATGLVAALLLVAAPFIPAEESAVTGAILCGFALGWAMLAVLSVRFTDQPQRWAAAAALFMGLGGLLLLVFGSSVREVLSWVWPPALLALAIWMIVRAHRQLRSRSRRWLLYPVIAMLALASLGGAYETVSEATDQDYPMPGQLIDVGGHRLHLNCTGSGSPTVVLQPGAGEMSSNMGWIAPAVARDTRVCVYDRAGRGWSEPADTPQDGTQIATDLHTLLQRGHVPGPYVLAGHSFGGLYVLISAARYPDEVAGMVLVDSTDPASAAKPVAASPGDGDSYDVMDRVSAPVSTSARLGLGRLYSKFDFGSLPPQYRDEVRANLETVSNLRSTINEYLQGNASTEQAASLRDFADKPLVVLTAGIGSDATHSAAQNRLATLSTNSVHRVIDAASHQTMIANKEGAAATTQAILDVVSSVRSEGPLVR